MGAHGRRVCVRELGIMDAGDWQVWVVGGE